jgi:hypothetical protein
MTKLNEQKQTKTKESEGLGTNSTVSFGEVGRKRVPATAHFQRTK